MYPHPFTGYPWYMDILYASPIPESASPPVHGYPRYMDIHHLPYIVYSPTLTWISPMHARTLPISENAFPYIPFPHPHLFKDIHHAQTFNDPTFRDSTLNNCTHLVSKT